MSTLPEKIQKLWIIKDFKILRVSELENLNEFKQYDGKSKKIYNEKDDVKIQTYGLYKEAKKELIYALIYKKKQDWDEIVALSYKLNEEIGSLYDDLDKLNGVFKEQEGLFGESEESSK